MGSGIAKQIRERFPEAYAVDLETVKGASKLGSISMAGFVRNSHVVIVINAYTQGFYGSERRHVDYDAVRSAMRLVKRLYGGGKIAYPRIGAGLGGGDWDVISKIIDEELEGEDHTLVEYAAK